MVREVLADEVVHAPVGAWHREKDGDPKRGATAEPEHVPKQVAPAQREPTWNQPKAHRHVPSARSWSPAAWRPCISRVNTDMIVMSGARDYTHAPRGEPQAPAPLPEAEYKYNTRKLTDGERTVKLIQASVNRRLTYKEQTSKNRDALGRYTDR